MPVNATGPRMTDEHRTSSLNLAVPRSVEDPDEVVHLDRNEAMFNPPPSAVRRIQEAAPLANVYPLEVARLASLAAAQYFGVEPCQLILTTGIDETIWTCVCSNSKECTQSRPGLKDIPTAHVRLDETFPVMPLTNDSPFREALQIRHNQMIS